MTHDMAWSSRQLYLTPCNPMDCISPGSSLHGIFQAKTLEWVAISYSRGSLNPSLLRLLHWAGGFSISVPPGKPFIPLEVPKQIVLWSSSHNSQIQQALKTENVIKSWILKHIQRQSLNWNKNFKNHSLIPHLVNAHIFHYRSGNRFNSGYYADSAGCYVTSAVSILLLF